MNTTERLTREVYGDFLDWYDAHGFDFPCTVAQFIARARAFAQGDDALVDTLCTQGIGSCWQDDAGLHRWTSGIQQRGDSKPSMRDD